MEETEKPTEPAEESDDKLGPWPRLPLREQDVERTPTFMPDPAAEPPAEPVTPTREGDLTARHPPPLRDPERTRVFSGGVPGHTVEKPEIEEEPTRWQPWGDTSSSQPTRPRPAWEPKRESQPTPHRQAPDASPAPARRPVASSAPPSVSRPRQGPKRDWMGGLLQAALYSAIAGVILFFVALAVASVGYVFIAAELPAPGELAARASDFETSTILDAQGNLLYELIPSDAGRRQRVSLNQVSELLVQATVATEDRYFYQHPGFDPVGIARAVVQNLQEQEVVSGASTITQQLARMLLLSPEERAQETMERKIREAILAAEITRRYSKEEILEIYLNELNYGNLAYGIEAAAQTYFQKPARELTLAEGSFLAGLPQAPAAWDPFTAPEYAIGRQGQVLALMVEAGYITWDQAEAAAAEMEQRISELIPPHVDMHHPHFVNSVRQELESLLGPQSSYRQGIRVVTTLDPALQATAEGVIAEHGPHLANWGANNAAMIAIDPHTGRILAMIGSVDFYSEEISGQVNMLLAGRQPGSSIKPLTYIAAFEKNWTASSLIWDVQTTFTDEWGQTYTPKNYDGRFHGPTLVRGALANSFNLPAVRALDFVGVCDFIQRANEIGIHSLQDSSCQMEGKPSRYGLSLTLGGGEVTPLEMATLYSTLAGNGGLNQPVTIARIEDLKGNLIYEHTPQPEQVIQPEHAFLINDILSDNASRLPAFGPDNRLEFTDRPVAAKTGTSGTDATDVRDGWTLGYTPDLVVAVWTGNTDNTPMAEGASGYKVASPIWRAYMDKVLVTQPASGFPRPANIVQAEICGDSGTRPSADCPAEARRWELYASGQPPLGPEHDFYQRLQVDLWTGYQANEHCGEAVEEELFLVIQDESGRRWIEETASGRAWAAARGIVLETRPGDPSPRLRLPPSEVCTLHTPRPRIRLTAPTEGQIITGELIIFGEVTAPNLRGYQVDYGLGPDPQGWGVVQDRVGVPVQAGEIARWDTTQVGDQDYTLRVIIFGPPDRNGTEIQFQGRVHVQVSNPTPTPTVTPTPTATYTPSPTPTPTETPSPSPTALTPTPSPTVLPSETPTPTPTGTSTPPPDTPTPTPTVEGTPTPTPTATETPSS